jgi:hypothetical protein
MSDQTMQRTEIIVTGGFETMRTLLFTKALTDPVSR